MASLSSAATRAFFALASSLFANDPALRENMETFFSLTATASFLGIMPKRGSLPSLFRPGIAVALAERSSAIVPDGPLETLRLMRSLESTRWRFLSFSLLVAVTRFAGAPGFGLDVATVVAFSLGACITGPPSLRLMESQSSGRRAEKLS